MCPQCKSVTFCPISSPIKFPPLREFYRCFFEPLPVSHCCRHPCIHDPSVCRRCRRGHGLPSVRVTSHTIPWVRLLFIVEADEEKESSQASAAAERSVMAVILLLLFCSSVCVRWGCGALQAPPLPYYQLGSLITSSAFGDAAQLLPRTRDLAGGDCLAGCGSSSV